MKMSMRKLSELTGYSPATISNALNHKKGVNEKTAEEIIRIAQETGYISEGVISKIKLVIFKKNGLIIDDSPFFGEIINGFEQECRNNGYEMVICNVDQRDRNYEEQVKELINDKESGIALLGTEMQEGDLDLYTKAKCPIVLLDYSDEKMRFDAVAISNQDSATLSIRYLLSKGHTNIGYLRGNYRIKAFRERIQGYRLAVSRKKIVFNEKNVITLSTTLNGAYQDMKAHLAKKTELPTAFVADDDMIALGAMKALQEYGLRIPEDISIVGFDDISFSEIASPPLTTVKVPNCEMGKRAVKQLIHRMNNNQDGYVKIAVCTTFVERDTVKDISK